MTVKEIWGHRGCVGEVGIEIETEGANLPEYIEKYWLKEHDGSLRGESAEYVLRRPVKRKEVNKVLNHLSASMVEAGAKVADSPRTSVHIHINCQELEMQEVMSFYCLYTIFEELLVKFCGDEREGNLFCLRSIDAEYLPEVMYDVARTQRWDKLGDNDLRYAAINVCALAKFGSLEFRAMRGTHDMSVLKMWIGMLLKIKDAAVGFEETRGIIESLSNRGEAGFLREIFGDKYADVLAQPDMEKKIRSGVRRVQHIAYATPNAMVKKPRLKVRVEPRPLIYAEVHGGNERDF